ncbi:HK97 family phage prohead protease [Bosea vestrisii]|uniref:HK97 family phage prohead protease n=1 Tax=Bosea vestrisii TaxID=151416 RepID=UPI0024DFA243|nr:HK97 family phage prohead protease [Bosea vestrisii]WID97001.1 HK97 family phage prohead protease [Bosea vestrisii]
MLVKGWASTTRLDQNNSILAAGAFDLAIAKRGLAGIALLLDHDWGMPAGRITRLETMGGRLWIEAILDPARPGVAARIALLRREKKHGFSVGGFKHRFRRQVDGTLLIRTADLREVSLTAYPRNTDCQLVFDSAPAKLWPADLQETLDEQDRAVAAAAKRSFIPVIKYEASQS